MTRPRMGVAAAGVLAAALVGAAAVLLLGGDDAAGGTLTTERQKRASGVQLAADERFLWGNFVVEAQDGPVVLRSAELLGADPRLRVRRVLVAGRTRPQSRILVFGERAFAQRPDAAAWREALRPLEGHRVAPVTGPREGTLTADGRPADTEILVEFEPLGRAKARVTEGLRVRYAAGGAERSIVLGNQLTVCAPAPCRFDRPEGW